LQYFSLLFKTRECLIAENLLLRQQILILKRKNKKPKLKNIDRIILVWISKFWNDWKSAMVIVKPETVIGWHKKGFKLYWKCKSRRVGRPNIDINLSDEKAEKLADELSMSDALWSMMPLFYEGEQRQAFTFGQRLSSQLKDIKRFLAESITVLECCENPNIAVLGGFLRGLDDSSATMHILSKMAESEKLASLIPPLLQYAGAKEDSAFFILNLLKENRLKIKDLNNFKYGSPLETLDPKEVEKFCHELSEYNIDGARAI